MQQISKTLEALAAINSIVIASYANMHAINNKLIECTVKGSWGTMQNFQK